jgi:hypothetical protein
LSNRLKCKQRVITENGKPYAIKFKGKPHNHGLEAYENKKLFYPKEDDKYDDSVEIDMFTVDNND